MNFLLLCFLSFFICQYIILTDGSLFLPTFDAEVVRTNYSTTLKFKCTVFQRPVDSLLHFLVNGKSVVVMYFSNERCFNKGTECNKDTCDCSYNDYSFTWFYPVNSSSFGSAFGVVTKIASEKNNEFMKLTLSGIYDKSGFKVNPSTCDEVTYSKETDKKIPKPNDEYEHLNLKIGFLVGILSACTAVLCLVVVVQFKQQTKRINESNKNEMPLLITRVSNE